MYNPQSENRPNFYNYEEESKEPKNKNRPKYGMFWCQVCSLRFDSKAQKEKHKRSSADHKKRREELEHLESTQYFLG